MNYFISTLTQARTIDPPTMRPFYSIQLLTISMVNDSGESLNLISRQFNPSEVDESFLKTIVNESASDFDMKDDLSLVGKVNHLQDVRGYSHAAIKKAIKEFTGGYGGYIWGYLPYNDFSVLEPMVDLKKFYTRDLKQCSDEISEMINDDFWVGEDSNYPLPSFQNIEKPSMPTSLQRALWNRDLYNFLIDFKKRNNLK